MTGKLVTAIAIVLALCSCARNEFYHIEDGRIVYKGVPQYFIGTNVWYAPQLALEDPGRLCDELDSLNALGLKNIRILATDENWKGLDRVFAELREREMCAVPFLNNAWEWSADGYRSYLELSTGQTQPHPAVDGYGAYMSGMADFARDKRAVELFREHVKRVVTRYRDETAVFSWQICNEPRPFASDPATFDAFADYITGTASLIKSLDPNHMVSTGNEGSMGCERSLDLFERIHACEDIDYCTIHIWPYNWSWVREDSIDSGVQGAVEQVGKYIDEHLSRAYVIRKPLVVEEFGYPRDGFEYVNSSSTAGRDSLYSYVFSRVFESALKGDRLAGCNFWTWSGLARQTPGHRFWQEGDDLCGDPSQEAQGLNGVYLCDSSTVSVIRRWCGALRRSVSLYAPPRRDWLYEGDGPYELEVDVAAREAFDIKFELALVSDLSLMEGRRDTVWSEDFALKGESGLSVVKVSLPALAPGFYQVNLGMAGRCPLQFNIGVNPEMIESPQDKPEDFDAFWEQTLAQLRAVPFNTVLIRDEEHSDSLRTSYRVEYDSWGGRKSGGILCVPNGEGPYDAYIDYMGYGSDPYWYAPASQPLRVEFLVSVRDQGIFKTPGGRWIDTGMGSKEEFYYRGAFCDVVRAVDFICSLPQVDKENICARGESQGGAFTWICASLDSRIRAIAPAVPFLSDYEDYGRIVWWPMWEMYEQAQKEGIAREDLHSMLRYFDVKNFTDRVCCPVLMAFGLQDPVCPPHTNFAGFNQVSGPYKEWFCVPTCGHAMWQEKVWTQKREEFLSITSRHIRPL